MENVPFIPVRKLHGEDIAAIAHRRMWINLASTLKDAMVAGGGESCRKGTGYHRTGHVRHGYRHEANDSKLSGFRLSAAHTHKHTYTHAHLHARQQ